MDLRISLLNFNFVTIQIIHKILVLIINPLIILKIIFSNAFLRSIIDFYFSKTLFFFKIYNNGKFKSCRRKHN